jgi:hypothetical protein
MKVYLVNEWDTYYPGADNTVAVFSTEEDARNFLLKYVKERKFRADRYDIFEKEVR